MQVPQSGLYVVLGDYNNNKQRGSGEGKRENQEINSSKGQRIMVCIWSPGGSNSCYVKVSCVTSAGASLGIQQEEAHPSSIRKEGRGSRE